MARPFTLHLLNFVCVCVCGNCHCNYRLQGERRVYDLRGVTSMRQGRLLPPPFFGPYNWCKSPAAARMAGGGGRASCLCDRDQRHSGYSLVPRPWEQGYSGNDKAQVRAFTQARSLRRSTHPQLPCACGRGFIIIILSPRCPEAY